MSMKFTVVIDVKNKYMLIVEADNSAEAQAIAMNRIGDGLEPSVSSEMEIKVNLGARSA
jgi:hypothetical protein